MGRLNSKAIGSLAVLMVATVVQMVRRGALLRYSFMLVASILSLVSLFAFPALIGRTATTERQRVAVRLRGMAAGLIPYVFGCYLFFYEGLWRGARLLMNHFSLGKVVLTALFLIGGYWVVRSTYRISEVAEKVRRGELVISDTTGL